MKRFTEFNEGKYLTITQAKEAYKKGVREGTIGKCPKCGSPNLDGLIPPDFESRKCVDCGKVSDQWRITEAATGLVEKTYTIEATPEVINNFERFLAHAQYCSGVGHSTAVAMSMDGDGPDRFRVLSPNVKHHVKKGEVASFDSGKFEMLHKKHD